jgi:uncharacterized membrane protein YoaK (UPF0700 family)
VQGPLIVLALLLALLSSEPFGQGVRYALTALLALAMGVQNAAAQRLAVPELTTTVLTRTLTGLASEAALVDGPGSKLGRRAVAIAAMLLGALAGGLLALKVSVASDLAVAAGVVLAVSLAVRVASRSAGAWTEV